jgi:hypothetical protein
VRPRSRVLRTSSSPTAARRSRRPRLAREGAPWARRSFPPVASTTKARVLRLAASARARATPVATPRVEAAAVRPTAMGWWAGSRRRWAASRPRPYDACRFNLSTHGFSQAGRRRPLHRAALHHFWLALRLRPTPFVRPLHLQLSAARHQHRAWPSTTSPSAVGGRRCSSKPPEPARRILMCVSTPRRPLAQSISRHSRTSRRVPCSARFDSIRCQCPLCSMGPSKRRRWGSTSLLPRCSTYAPRPHAMQHQPRAC